MQKVLIFLVVSLALILSACAPAVTPGTTMPMNNDNSDMTNGTPTPGSMMVDNPEAACTDLKTQINSVMDELGGTKLIAYPWPSLGVPLVMTSWGRLQRFETFDSEQAKAFYRANLNRAPEPDAP